MGRNDKRSKPNILWYCTDQQRWDTVGRLGNDHINTPVLDKLVDDGVAFLNAYCQSPICTPSRASFLTSTYPNTHHVQRNGARRFPKDPLLVSKVLHDSGYKTGLVGKLHLSRAQGQIEIRPDDGYDSFEYCQHPYPDGPEPGNYAEWLRNEKGVDIGELYSHSAGEYGAGPDEEVHQTTWCTEKAIEFIRRNRQETWFLSVNTFDPHPPFDPPRKYLERYNPSTLPLPTICDEDIARATKFESIDQQTVHPYDWRTRSVSQGNAPAKAPSAETAATPPSDYDPQMVKACYYAAIEQIDTQFGRIVSELDRQGLVENTIVIFMSDHGEMLGDHGLLYKGCRFYEPLVHVPLIVSWPGHFSSGLRLQGLVELIDVAPTILESAGIAIPESFQGMSLCSMLTGSVDGSTHRTHVISEYNDALLLPHHSHGTMYFDGRYKSIVYHGTGIGEIFDLQNDANELNDLWDEPSFHENKCRTMQKHFDAFMSASTAGPSRTASY